MRLFHDLFDVVAYEALYLVTPSRGQLFFNSGYLPIDPGLAGAESYGDEAHCAMMYHFAAKVHPGTLQRAPRSILDVGCGQGGGLLCLSRAFPDAMVVGTDRSASAVLRARRNLSGNRHIRVERTPIGGSGFFGENYDLVIGVGTPTYVGLSRFIAESRRVLAPGGILSITGGYRRGSHDDIRSEILGAAAEHGFVLASYRDIVANTFAALEADIPRRERALARVPWPFRQFGRRWSDLPGSPEYLEYVQGQRADFAAVLHLPG